MTDKNIDYFGSGIFTEHIIREVYNVRYQQTYKNRSYVKSKYYKNMQDYVGCIQGEQEKPHIVYILRVNHILMMKDPHSSYYVL